MSESNIFQASRRALQRIHGTAKSFRDGGENER